MKGLKDKVAIVTGAGSGLGRGMAQRPVTVITAVVLGPSIAAALQALADHRAGRDLRLGRETEPA